MTIKQYKELPGYGRPAFIQKGPEFSCDVWVTLGAVLVTIPPDMSRKQAVKKALALAEFADRDYKARAAAGEGKA